MYKNERKPVVHEYDNEHEVVMKVKEPRITRDSPR